MRGFVYFLQMIVPEEQPAWIKIGFARNPLARMWLLQTGCPYILRPLGWFPGTRLHEKELHRIFSELRFRGEWFYPKQQLLESIAMFEERFPDHFRQAHTARWASLNDRRSTTAPASEC